MIVAKNCYFWSVFPQISCGGYPQNLSKFPKPHFLLTCTYFGGRRHGRNLPMAKATDGLAFGVTRHCRIEGLPPVPPTPLPVLELIFQLASYKHVDHWCFATCFFEGFDGSIFIIISMEKEESSATSRGKRVQQATMEADAVRAACLRSVPETRARTVDMLCLHTPAFADTFLTLGKNPQVWTKRATEVQ